MTKKLTTPHTVFFIPGMFSPFINTFLGTYFIDQMEFLDRHRISHEIIKVHTEGTLERNAKVIRDRALLTENITAFCHSKGGVDLLHALIYYPEIRERFSKITFMQCPFFGTPLADVATNGRIRSEVTGHLFKLVLRGELASIQELSTEFRRQYMTTHEASIAHILSLIPISCIGSSKPSERGRFDSLLKIPRDYMHVRYGIPNDGMIPTTSAFIPGAAFTKMENLDHASAVIRLTPQSFDRKAFTQDIFAGVLQ